MGYIVNTEFVGCLLHKHPEGLTRDEFYRKAEEVGWIRDETSRAWTAGYVNEFFDDRVTGGILNPFVLEGGKLRLKDPQGVGVVLSPLIIYNVLSKLSRG